jgi:hypothetical protein
LGVAEKAELEGEVLADEEAMYDTYSAGLREHGGGKGID